MASHDPSSYQFSTPTYVVLFTTLLTAYYMYDFTILFSVTRLTFTLIVGTPQCRKRVASKCKHRASQLSGTHSPSSQGEPSRSPSLSRQRMGKSSANFNSPALLPCSFRNRLLISGWWRYSRKPVGQSHNNMFSLLTSLLFLRTTSPIGP